ncbi:3-ketoacyl-ACP reductase [Rhodococcus sp. IITR03]|nr:3-ketoacyl-ACP reductase [Rhodococcus sp. IITR03]
MNSVAGKVALVTGAARGQGRSHAIELARAGADILALDVGHDLPELGLGYPMGSAKELAETARQVEELDRRVLTAEVDVRDYAALAEFVDRGVTEFGRLDIVAANAGIAANATPAHELTEEQWEQMLAINLTGVWKTCKAAVPHVIAAGNGGSIILTSSVLALRVAQGVAAYSAAKHGVVGLMKTLAAELAQYSIRVNSVLPTQVDTPMIMNDETFKLFRPDLENPTRDDFMVASQSTHALPVPVADSLDISKALLFLASDDARLITGVPLPVDAGSLVV